MNDYIKPSSKIHTIDDAIRLSKRRLPKLVFDFIDGASGDDKLAEIDPIPVIVATPSIKHAANILKLPSAPLNSRKANFTYIGSQF